MAKFKFSLKSVEKYRNIALDEVKAKYAKAVSDINKQNDIIVKLKQELSNVNQELNDKNRQGITILEHQGYKVYIKILENNIKNEEEKLIGLQKIEQRRRKELIAAKTDVMSIEKIREKRFEEYVKEETKKEELGIEEFVSNQLSSRK
ncbi:MAG: flagellar export protein FliJ [Clostridiales bacterium]|jgi:flagellar FliJ protein|uniref:flagellar export protein FliJ n=1 Tax=Aminipila sp. TaxID=2060095 RepID=UPI001DA85463|nr:flagellar export protein FliJ [Aminipila sp.]MBE6033286.1 flagellar export protein FliJ [Clostridiales bacterium]